MANSNFLPQTNVVLNDLGLKIAPPPAGPKVMLLGVTSNDTITLLEPFTVNSVEKALNGLWFTGASGSNFPGELALAVEEASQAGANSIEVMVINHLSGVELEQYVHPTGQQTGRFGDLSGAYDILKNRDVDVVVPVGAYIDATGLPAADNFGKQLADFCFQVTTEQNAANGVIGVAPITWWAAHHGADRFSGLNGSVQVEVAALTGGASTVGIKNAYFGTPSSTLPNLSVDYHTDNQTPYTASGWPTKNAKYGNYQSGSYDDSHNRFADAATSATLNASYFSSWQAVDNDGALATDNRSVKVDAGAYLSVIVSPLKVNSTQTESLAGHYGALISNTSYITDGAASYAGLVNNLAPHSATTNKFVPGVFPLKLISRTQANRLVGMRTVTMYQRSKGFVVAKDVTGAHNVNRYLRSDYVLLTTVRIVHTAVDLIRAVTEEFIGEPNNAPQMNAMNNEIDQVLLSMKGSALNAYDFVVSATPDQRVLGEVDIDLTLVPAFEITQINLTVSLAKTL